MQFHTAMRPYRIAEVDSIISYEEVFPLQKLEGKNVFEKLWNWTAYDDWVKVNTEDFHLAINPLINFSGGMETESEKVSGQIQEASLYMAISARTENLVSLLPFVKINRSFLIMLLHLLKNIM